MRMKALYLASFMSDVVKPYIEQTNDVTPGMSTSMDMSDRKAVTCQSDISEWQQYSTQLCIVDDFWNRSRG